MNPSIEDNADILQLVSEATTSLLPAKSREKYERTYQQFCNWRNAKNVQGDNENILIAHTSLKRLVLFMRFITFKH